MKICTKCGEAKYLPEFYSRKRAANGLRSECKSCTNSANKEYFAVHPGAAKKNSQEWVKRNPEKRRAIKQAWSRKNPDAIREMNKKQHAKRIAAMPPKAPKPICEKKPPDWKAVYQATREACLERNRKWRERNRESERERYRKYSKDNPDKRREKFQQYRAKKFSAVPKWANREAMLAVYAEARRMAVATGIPHHVDHVVPLNHPLVQGLHVERNLRVIPGAANSAKGNRHWPDMPSCSSLTYAALSA